MLSLINAERKRILPKKIMIAVILFVLLYTGYGTCQSVKYYEIWGKGGVSVSAKDNLNYTKNTTKNKWINAEYMKSLRDGPFVHRYLDRVNLDALCYINYGEKVLRDLNDQELKQFYQNRLAVIKNSMESSNSTREEKKDILKKEKRFQHLSMGYAEGWKNLNENMGKLMEILLMVTAVILLPVFGTDAGVKMEELCRTAKKGKRQLDLARLFLAFFLGSLIYVIGNILYFILRMAPFGLEGAGEPIQNSARYFFSICHITYLQQYGINLLLGFLTMLFVISFTLLTTILVRRILAGGVVLVFAGGILVLMEQIQNAGANHWFANFMPLRMIDFSHYYLDHEIYRIFGNSIPEVSWTAIVSAAISILFSVLLIVCTWKRQKKGRR